MCLEFAKVCIRTVTEKVQAEIKKQEKGEEELLNRELEIAIASLEKSEGTNNVNLIDYIEELRSRKAVLVDEKGKKLADRLGTKWYNEGEKSTRYFFRLLNKPLPDKFTILEGDNGEEIIDEIDIESEIVRFYRDLYDGVENPEISVNNDPSFFDQITGVNRELEASIVQPITESQLLAILGTCSDSAPGPDGIPYSYLAGLWSLVGPLMVSAWNHSLVVGKLSPSHKLSFLRLIPKIGKDLKKLTNWRPITLSNCDHKLITKIYAQRLCTAMDDCIKGNQTAYIKGRMINDNIRSILCSVNVANLENNIDGLIVSLDAKKAFDSVSHEFIETCLTKFGVGQFVPIFRILYKDLHTNILINQKIVDGYDIKRGVKQGDALSCILFIMCVEPLLRNIESNRDISPIQSVDLDSALPKAYAYADDVSVVTNNSAESMQAIFREYERLSRVSGLELNANKTELLRIKSGGTRRQLLFDVSYLGSRHRITSKAEIKLNGILIQQDQARMKTANVENVARKIEDQCRKWSRRRLCILGKILILKTFGISQIIYLLQSIKLDLADFKKFNAVLYKFIWNRHFEAAKAPERIAREIINTPIKLGGFGMLNVNELDAGIKLKALGRMFDSNHPMLKLIKAKLNLAEFFFPKIDTNLDPFSSYGIELLKQDRQKAWLIEDENLTVTMVASIREVKLSSAVSRNGRNSLAYFGLRQRGLNKIAELDRRALNSIRPFIDINLYQRSCHVISLRINTPQTNLKYMTLLKNKLEDIRKKSSKEIRDGRTSYDPICLFRSGPIQSPSETLTWARKLNSLTNTRLKSILLRVSHKEVYSREKLHRFGLSDSPQCPRCDEVETFHHKLYECVYARKIWEETFKITDKLLNTQAANIELQLKANGMAPYLDSAALAIHAEIFSRIIALRIDGTYLIRPKLVALGVLNHLIRRERHEQKRVKLRELLLEPWDETDKLHETKNFV